jgi:hypothetical protein
MYLGSATWGSAFVSMYGEVREGIAVGVAYYGRVLDGGKMVLAEEVFKSRAAMRFWVNTSGKHMAMAK